MLIASSIKPVTNNLHPRCIRRGYDSFETNLFLVHDDSSWQQNELDVLENILLKYQQCGIELLILRKENSTYEDKSKHVKYGFHPLRPKRQTKGRRRSTPRNKTEPKLDLNINIGAKKLLQAFLERRRHLNVSAVSTLSSSTASVPHLPTINDIIIKFPRMVVTNISESKFFEDSPLYSVWRNFNKDTLIFAARVLKLWENGGISFAIPCPKKNDNVTEFYKYEHVQNISTSTATSVEINTTVSKEITPKEDVYANNLLKNMIEIGYSSFHNLPEGLVTVDEEGIHMETKTTCHAFFGEALVQLKHADNATTIAKIIKSTLRTFCLRGAVDSEYCNSAMYK